MRALILAGMLLLLSLPAAAQEHRPPTVRSEDWSLPCTTPVAVDGGRAGLSRLEATAFSGNPVQGDFTLETTLAYRDVADGDVVGIALRAADGGWISLQLEQITPALLVAVREHRPGGIDAHGRLLATTAVAGWHEGRIRLRMARGSGMVQFAHARVGGDWEVLGPAFPDPPSGSGEVGLSAVHGAER